MSVHIHNEWQDSMADWASQHADELKAAEPRRMVTMQGRPEQGWPARRCSPEVQPHIVDRLREDYDTEDQQPLTGREALRFWLVTGAPAFCGVIGFALLIWLTKP